MTWLIISSDMIAVLIVRRYMVTGVTVCSVMTACHCSASLAVIQYHMHIIAYAIAYTRYWFAYVIITQCVYASACLRHRLHRPYAVRYLHMCHWQRPCSMAL